MPQKRKTRHIQLLCRTPLRMDLRFRRPLVSLEPRRPGALARNSPLDARDAVVYLRIVARRFLGGRDSSHRPKLSPVSLEGRPANRLATLMSSSRSGQWMPSPELIRRQLDRCARVPCRSLGNQAIGTVMVRPSDNSTVKLSLPTIT